MIERVRRAELPAIGVVHDDWPIYGPHVDGWTRLHWQRPVRARLLERLLGVPALRDLGAAGRWTYNSRLQRERCAGVLPGGEVIAPGADLDLFEPVHAGDWSWRLLCCGRIDRRKGIDVAVSALAELPRAARLDVVGAGDREHEAELAALAARVGVAERIASGPRPRAALPASYAAADVLLFPVRWQEPFGLVPLEAMAVGTPVVASGRGGSAEYLRDGENCLVVDPDAGAAAWAAAVRRLADDASLRGRLREAGLATAREHSQARFTERLSALVEEAA